MSERKVLNKYYPPDFDPLKLRRVKLPKNRQFTVRIMAPFNMRCVTCGEYIYKGKKFNARKEDVENDDYLGVRIYRFYIKCTRCLQEISFKTDPRNTDYEMEAGATRNFMTLKVAEEKAAKEEEMEKEEEQNNPMKLLENRTKQSKNEIELLERLEELKELNQRQSSVDYDSMLDAYNTNLQAKEMEKRQQELDEEFIKTVKFESSKKRKIVVEQEIVELEKVEPAKKHARTDSLASSSQSDSKVVEIKLNSKSSNNTLKSKGIGNFNKSSLSGFIKINKPTTTISVESSDSTDEQKSALSLLCDYPDSDSE